MLREDYHRKFTFKDITSTQPFLYYTPYIRYKGVVFTVTVNHNEGVTLRPICNNMFLIGTDNCFELSGITWSEIYNISESIFKGVRVNHLTRLIKRFYK